MVYVESKNGIFFYIWVISFNQQIVGKYANIDDQ